MVARERLPRDCGMRTPNFLQKTRRLAVMPVTDDEHMPCGRLSSRLPPRLGVRKGRLLLEGGTAHNGNLRESKCDGDHCAFAA